MLTQGRALGVVVVAMVQDPRKETVSMRGLFTQTVALRLRSAEETRMVLGDGMAALAPAHRISPAAPGTGYVVGDDGTVDLVRADWWSDELVRQAADDLPRPHPAAAAVESGLTSRSTSVAPVAITARPRKPRRPGRPPAGSGRCRRDERGGPMTGTVPLGVAGCGLLREPPGPAVDRRRRGRLRGRCRGRCVRMRACPVAGRRASAAAARGG